MIPQPHVVSLFRPIRSTDASSQNIVGYEPVARDVSCYIQPYDSREEFFYAQRGLEDTGIVYTSRTDIYFDRDDVLLFGERQFHVVGVVEALMLNIYTALNVVEYPETARKRLNMEDYESI